MKYKHGKSVHFCAKITQKRIDLLKQGRMGFYKRKSLSQSANSLYLAVR